MQTRYIPHTFGDEVEQKLRQGNGWLTAGVASSIAWPSLDVCVHYAGDDYFLRGSSRAGKSSPPGISFRSNQNDIDKAIAKVYRFTSILSWFLDGYVEVSGYMWGSRAFLYGDARTVYSSLGLAGDKAFNCNHMPIIENESVRKALAFYREGMRLKNIHDSYAFLSFYKVIESQFKDSKKKADWIATNIDSLSGDAAKRVVELRASGIDVSRHLFESGRCAIAHASLEGEVVDPDVPSDRRRLSADLAIMRELARNYIRNELKVPTSRSLYETRNRLEPWESLVDPVALQVLKSGGTPENLSSLDGLIVSVGLWPDGIIAGLDNMTMRVDGAQEGVVRVVLIGAREAVLLVFYLDFQNGRIHTDLEQGGMNDGSSAILEEIDIKAYSTFFYYVLGNRIAELHHAQLEPVDCEVVIPVNIIPPDPEVAIAEAVERFRNAPKPTQANT